MITKEQIIETAKTCFDPEIPVNIWDLGLIYDIDITAEPESVSIRMSLTSEHCPAAKSIPEDLKNKIKTHHKVENIDIKIVFDPPWTPERISEAGKQKLGIETE